MRATHRDGDPNLTPAAMIARAEALRPLLLEQQDEAEVRGYYSEQIHQEFLQAGFSRILQPRRFGGYEFDVPTFFKVMVEISRGDPGTGWCLCLGSGHVLPLASHYSEQAQKEIFGPDGDFRAPHRATPNGTATPVSDGYLVNGVWDYCSGIPYATHFMGTALVTPEGQEPPPGKMIVVVVPQGSYTMLDDWGDGTTLGLQASGSHSVVLKDVFVPSHYTAPFDWLSAEPLTDTPGLRLHGNPMYLGRVAGFYQGELVSVQVGAAKAALDEYECIMKTKKTLLPPRVQRLEHLDSQRSYGMAMGMIDAAEAILMQVGEKYMTHCRKAVEEGIPFTVADDMRLWGTLQQAGRLSWEATELLFRTASSGAAKKGQRLQRYFRDLAMYRGHVSAQIEELAPMFTKVQFGLSKGLFGD